MAHLKRRINTGDWLKASGLFIGLLAVYYPALRGRPIWDDDSHLTRPELRSWAGLGRIWFEPGATQQYYPLTHSAFWLMNRLWGDWFTGYHLVNVLLHGVSALLLVKILRKLEIPGAWLAAALWAIHPMQVESVAWMSELKNTLSGVFYFGAALAYLDFDRDRRWKQWIASLFLFLLGLLSKSVIGTLPAALLLIFYWKKQGKLSWRKDVWPLAPFFGAGIGAGFFTSWVERVYIGANGAEFHFTLLDRCLIAGRAFWFNLGRLFWPANLLFIYPRWQISAAIWWQFLFPAAALALAAALAWARKRWGAGPLAAVLYFAGTLFPALGFVNIYPFRFSFVADHFQYLAGIGPIALVAASLTLLADSRGAEVRLLAQAFSGALLALLGLLTLEQSPMYGDAETLWRTTLAGNPECWMAHNNLGHLLFHRGDIEGATAQYQEALRINPEYAEARVNLGDSLQQSGQPEEAIAEYKSALAINPLLAPAAYDLGNTLLAQNRIEEAIAQYGEAVRINPAYAEAHNNLGFALLQQGRTEEAIAEIREAQSINPGDPETEFNLGNALLREGKTAEAIGHTERALQLQPGNPGFQNAVAWVLATAPEPSLRDGARALKLAQQACQASGMDNPGFLRTLAAAYAQEGQFPDAVRTAQRALQLAEAQPSQPFADALRRELRQYQAGQPYQDGQ